MTSSLHAGGGEDRARRRRPLGRGAPTRNDAGEPGGKRLAVFVSWRQARRRALQLGVRLGVERWPHSQLLMMRRLRSVFMLTWTRRSKWIWYSVEFHT